MQVSKYWIVLMIGLIHTSCDRKEPDHNNKTEVIGRTVFNLQYRPAESILMGEGEGIAGRSAELKGVVWFNMQLKIEDYGQSPLRYGITSNEEYNARLNYYLNGAKEDIYMLYKRNKIYVHSYWFENNQNLTDHETMVFSFLLPEGEDKPDADMQIVFHDKMYNSGIVKFLIKK